MLSKLEEYSIAKANDTTRKHSMHSTAAVEHRLNNTACKAHLVDRLQVQRQMRVVDSVIFCAVIDVWDLADVVLLLLLIVEGLEQLAPPVKHQKQPLTPTWHPSLQQEEGGDVMCLLLPADKAGRLLQAASKRQASLGSAVQCIMQCSGSLRHNKPDTTLSRTET